MPDEGKILLLCRRLALASDAIMRSLAEIEQVHAQLAACEIDLTGPEAEAAIAASRELGHASGQVFAEVVASAQALSRWLQNQGHATRFQRARP